MRYPQAKKVQDIFKEVNKKSPLPSPSNETIIETYENWSTKESTTSVKRELELSKKS